MSQNFNSPRPPAPIYAPLLTSASMRRILPGQDQGLVTQPWTSFFTPLADVIDFGPTLQGTHAQRINTDPQVLPYFDPGRFLNYLFFETDTRALYVSQLVAGAGTVTTAGITVTWISGTRFLSAWAGSPITINGVQYIVDSVASDISLTLVSTAGVQVAVAYSQAGVPAWVRVFSPLSAFSRVGPASADLTPTTAMQDIVQATVDLTELGLYKIFGVFDFTIGAVANQLLGELDIFYSATDHVQAGNATFSNNSLTSMGATVMQTWYYNNTIGAVTAKLRAKAVSAIGVGVNKVNKTNTQITADLIG